MQELTPLELAVQLMSDLSVPVHCTLSSQILPVPASKLAPTRAAAPKRFRHQLEECLALKQRAEHAKSQFY